VQRPGWDPYQGRYFILAVVPLAPLFGVLIPRRGFGKWVIPLVLSFITIIISFNTLLTNDSKPIFTSRSVAYLQNKVILPLPENNKFKIVGKTYLVKLTNGLLWRLPQREPIIGLAYYDQLFYSDTDIIPVIEMIQDEIPADEPIYLMMNRDPLEYALFGINRTRKLFPVKSGDDVPPHDYLLVDKIHEQPLMGFDLVIGTEQFKLYRRSK
jgi:hypothetical protein